MGYIFLSVLITLGIGSWIYDLATDEDDDNNSGSSDGSNSDDNIQGGPGNDALSGLLGDDVINGQSGNDTLYGGRGSDILMGGSGDDRIFLGNHDDFVNPVGDEGNDFIRGGANNDTIHDSLGANTLHGDTGHDTLNGVDDPNDAGTEDTLYGGFGNDTLIGDDGDALYGGNGYDTFEIEYLLAHNEIAVVKDFDENIDNGIVITAPEFDAFDTLSFSETTLNGASGLMVTLANSQVAFIEGATLSAQHLISFDPDSNPNSGGFAQMNGTAPGGDVLLGTPGKDSIRGLGGGDGLFGGSGDDLIYGGSGDDVAYGGYGDDRIFLNDGEDETYGGIHEGNDLIRGGAGIDLVQDWAGSNTLYGDTGSDSIDGFDNLDRNTPDTLYGGFGDDVLAGDEGDIFYGGQGFDTYDLVFDANRATNDLAVINDYDVNTDGAIFLYAAGYGANPTFNTVQGHSYNNQTGLLVQIGNQNQNVLFLPGVTVVPSIFIFEYQGTRV